MIDTKIVRNQTRDACVIHQVEMRDAKITSKPRHREERCPSCDSNNIVRVHGVLEGREHCRACRYEWQPRSVCA